ncbi:MAG: tetratricopeptide repeat protein [Bacteroidetes bacterium]|nr:tetratricopeptide repeat protein [Bacteroidota bacterium]
MSNPKSLFNTIIAILLFTILLFIKISPAQDQHKADSLIAKFKTAIHDTDKIKLLIEKGKIYKNTLPDTALYFYNMAFSEAVKTKSAKYAAHSLRYIADVYSDKGLSTIALEYYIKSLNIFEKLNDKNGKADCYNNIGIVYNKIGSYDKSLEFYMKALKIREELNDKKGISNCYSNIGIIFYYQKSYDKALEYYIKTIKIKEKLDDKYGMANCFNNIGNVYAIRESYDTALIYFIKSLKIFEYLGIKEDIGQCYTNIGNLYSNTHNYNKAVEFYTKSLKISEENNNKYGQSYALLNIADLYINLKKYNEAVGYAHRGLKITKETGALFLQVYAYEKLAIAYDSLHNYKNAYKYFKLSTEIKDSIFNKEKSKQITDIQTKYETNKKEQNLVVKEKELEVLKIKRYILYATLVFVIIVASLIVLWLRYKIKVTKKISETEKELIQTRLKDSENEKKVLNLQLKNKNLELEKMNQELEYKNKELKYKNQELINFALHIVEKNDFLEKIKSTLLNPGKSTKTKEIVQSINQNLMSLEKEKQEFEANIEQVCQIFFMKLRENYPEITKNEERLSALLKLNFSSKEIAMMLNISSQSIDNYRYKLRRKLKIDEDISLYDFLNSI